MDIFEYRAARKVNTEGVFTAINNDSEIGGLFTRLKNIMTSEIHLQWDILFLEQYISESMVPRSLRWEVHPQQGDPDLDSWYKYFNEAGIKFLDFLVTRKKTRLPLLDREIKEIKDKLLTFKNSNEYNSLSGGLQTHLEKEDRDQKNKKRKKYSRDLGDYKSGSVFSWQKFVTPNSLSEIPMESEVSTTNTTSTAQTNPAPMRSIQTPNRGRGSTRGTPIPHPRNGDSSVRPSAQTQKNRGNNTAQFHKRGSNNQTQRGGRGQYLGNHYDSRSYPHNNYGYQSQYNPSQQWNEYPGPQNIQRRPSTRTYPATYNRFAPLQDTYNDDYRHYLADEFEPSSYEPNQYDYQSYENQVFQQDIQGRKRAPDSKEAAEGGGESRGKRRRV